MPSSGEREAWSLDQLTKSEFFHQKLHAWGMVDIAYQIEQIKGETLSWDLNELGISQKAWDKVIHRGIKPVLTFAHPQVLMSVSRAVGYYRMLAMVSQKSMNRVGLATARYEEGKALIPSHFSVLAICLPHPDLRPTCRSHEVATPALRERGGPQKYSPRPRGERGGVASREECKKLF